MSRCKTCKVKHLLILMIVASFFTCFIKYSVNTPVIRKNSPAKNEVDDKNLSQTSAINSLQQLEPQSLNRLANNKETLFISESYSKNVASINESFFKQAFTEVTSLGCLPYVEPDKRQKKLWFSFNTTSTIDCLVGCSKKNAIYAETFNGTTCICSFGIIDIMANPFKERNSCTLKCQLNKNESCGGKDSVQAYKLKSYFDGEKNVTESFVVSRSTGCFQYIPHQNKNVLQTSVKRCILYCGVENFPLALWKNASQHCICDRFSRTFNLSQKQLTCEEESWKVYRTLAENKLCKPFRFLPEKSSYKRIVLLSSPGSGNTWARHLLQQASGIYTGSIYGNTPLYRSGYIGEKSPVDRNQTLVVKDHFHNREHIKNYDGTILIVRNPYHSLIAEYNRGYSVGVSQIGHADADLFYTSKFKQYSKSGIKLFNVSVSSVFESKKPFYLLIYEDLVKDPITETRKLMTFIKNFSGFEPKDSEQRFLCLSENLQGDYKRKSRKLEKDPYTEEMKKEINSVIDSARSMLHKLDSKLTLPKYEV